MNKATLVWHRLDLRLADNSALSAAIERGGPVIPVFIWSPEEEGPWAPGGASRWWLHQSLQSLSEAYRQLGSRLVLRSGPSLIALRSLIRETGAGAVVWNRRYEPAVIARDTQIKSELKAEGLEVETFNAALLHEPWTIQNQAGKPFQVFTPFWKHCLQRPDPSLPLSAPAKVQNPSAWPKTDHLGSFELEPKTNWAGGMRAVWRPGEQGAQENLTRFLKNAHDQYPTLRDRPDLTATSRLSPHLHFGELSPRQIWAAAGRAGIAPAAWRASRFLSEVGWREFAHHLLYHFPHTPQDPLRPEFGRFRWRSDKDWLKRWEKGETGYPIVDAGMRELWTTGWMHNRVRMIVASFLVKDLLISWREGASWFWDTLVDADLAQNTLGWQWTAGCGADAAPYFRVFNPVMQGEKFDPQGDYVKRWCPELAGLPGRWLHQPWAAPSEVLSRARLRLGENYPEPVVSHAIAREVALEEYGRLKG